MKLRTPFTALVAGAGAVMVIVRALGAIVFESPASPVQPAGAGEDPTSTSPDATPPPSNVFEISGDRQAHTEDITFSWEKDPDGAVFLRHFLYDALDFFLQPGECTLTPGDIDATGNVPVQVECIDIADIRETATITLRGSIDFSYADFPPPGINLGGELVVGGDIETTLAVDYIDWTVSEPETVDPEFPSREISASGQTDETFFSLDLVRHPTGGLYVKWFNFNQDFTTDSGYAYFELDPGECPVGEEFVQDTGPATAVYRLTLSCSSLETDDIEGIEGGDYTISLEGELTAHRLDLTGP